MDQNIMIAGGISGAITDPDSLKARQHAELYYEEIRHNHTDAMKIAQNTGVGIDQILRVKHYLFLDEHYLGGVFKRFDANFHIAESWRRLAYDPKNIQPHDITLLRHESYEMSLVDSGYSQSEAHRIASREFDYSKESEAYYHLLKLKQDKNYLNQLLKNPVEENEEEHEWEERY